MLARTHRILLALAASAALLAVAASGARAADVPLSTRFAQTLRGDVRSVGNTLMSCTSGAACSRARDRNASGGALNNDYDMGFVDTDGDASTSNSSSADLALPAGATVVWAGLYWGADTSAGSHGSAGNAATRDRVRFKRPGGTYQTVAAQPADVLTSSWHPTRYRGFADVTSLLAASGTGRYWVANVQAGTGVDRYAGWALMVAYRDSTQAIRRVNVLDGMATVGIDRPLAMTIGPFLTPETGAVRSNAGLLAFEGDAGTTGDSLTFDGLPAADALNPADNVFNSTVSANGTSAGVRNPSYANTFGLDLDSTSATGVLGNGQTSASLALSSTTETVYLTAFYLVSDEGPAVNTARPAVTGTPRDGSVLSASTGTWKGTPTLAYAYEWQRCDAAGAACAAIPGATGATYSVTGADVDRTLRALVTARNDAGTSAPAASATTGKVARRPPVNATLPVVSGTARDGATLATTLGTWTGTGPLDYTVRWLRCAADGAGCTPIAGATGTSYTAGPDDVGHALRSEVRATNSAGEATAQSLPAGPVAAAAPISTGAPSLTGTARERETLSATPGTWSGTPAIGFTYAWERCNADGGGCAAIPGATTATYALTPADVEHRMRVAVTAHNAGGSAVARSGLSDVIAAALARNTAAPTVDGPDADRVLTSHPGTWEGTLGTLSYGWERCSAGGDACAAIAGAIGRTYTLTEADGGRTLRVAVTMTNAAGPATALSGVTGRMPYPAPLNLVPPSIAGPAERGAVLTARPGAWHAPGSPTLSFAWQRCDVEGEACVALPGAAAGTYTPVAADVGRTLRVAVTAANDGGRTTVTSNATATIAEPAPPAPAPKPEPSVTSTAPATTGGVAGTTSSQPAPDLATVPGSLVADAACQLVRGARTQQATLSGIGVVVLRATVRGAATPIAPLRLSVTGGRVAGTAYALDGRPLATTGARAALTPAQLGAAGRHTVTATLRGRSGGQQAVSLTLRTAACPSRFTGRRSRSGLRLRVDSRSALTRIDFTVPARLRPRQTAAARPIGTLRLLVAGERSPRTAGLVLPATGSAAPLLGSPSVRATRTGLTVSGLPAGTAAVELTLTRTASLDGAAPRGPITLRAKVRRAGARTRTLTLHV